MNYTISMNEPSGIVEAVVTKVCDVREIAEYERQLLIATAGARRTVGHLRLLVDSSQVGPLPVSSINRLMLLEDRLIKHEDDRVAVLVGSSFAKAQLAKSSTKKQVNRFVSINAARMWLCAFDGHGSQIALGLRAMER